ncbi:MAG: response regulator [Phycisphaerales bacterium]|nr:response regulator [Phycisphaerales bacterium]
MSQNANTSSGSQRILVVEDSYLIGMQLKQDLNTFGHEVIGPAPNVKKALRLISEHEIGIAILDINLSNENSYPVASALADLKIPFFFITGYDSAPFEDGEYSDRLLLRKPILPDELMDALDDFLRTIPAA